MRKITHIPAQPTESEEAIINALKAWRRDKANEKAVPEFTILLNANINDIAAHKPQTLETLKQIKGITRAKLKKHGADLITIINRNPTIH